MKIFEFWQNPDGSLSSRRLFGTALLTVAIVGYFSKLDAILHRRHIRVRDNAPRGNHCGPQKPGGAA